MMLLVQELVCLKSERISRVHVSNVLLVSSLSKIIACALRYDMRRFASLHKFFLKYVLGRLY